MEIIMNIIIMNMLNQDLNTFQKKKEIVNIIFQFQLIQKNINIIVIISRKKKKNQIKILLEKHLLDL